MRLLLCLNVAGHLVWPYPTARVGYDSSGFGIPAP